MGWMFCGEDSKGRPIGYGIPATCDYPGCARKIDRGLSYACGGMHGNETMRDAPDGVSCEGYFCSKHQHCSLKYNVLLCPDCYNKVKDEDDEIE